MKEKEKKEIENIDPNIDYRDIMKDKKAYLSYDEINKMLKYCLRKDNKKTTKLKDYMLILLLSRTGRRVSEIVGRKPFTTYHGLRPVDLHHENSLIEWHILKKRPIRSRVSPHGKKRTSETMEKMYEKKKPPVKLQPIDNKTMQILRRYIEVNRIGMYDRIIDITRERAWMIVSEVAEKAKISRKKGKIHPHMFRHGFSINFLKQNPYDAGALVKLQRILDHSSIEITQAYAQFTPEDIKQTLNEIFKEEEK